MGESHLPEWGEVAGTVFGYHPTVGSQEPE